MKLRATMDFLTWLDEQNLALADCRQSDVDLWLETGPSAKYMRDFLLWTAEHKHCRPLHVAPPPRTNGAATDPEQRWKQITQLLHDHSIDLTDRVAGGFVLLYGQHLSRTAEMTTGQITARDSVVIVRFGRDEIELPSPLGTAALQLARTGRSHTGIGSPASRWLFPGGLPGRPITAAQLGHRLREPGISPLPGRRATMTHLAAHLPAAVLADLLNLTPGTAVRWMREVGADWTRYAAELLQDDDPQTMTNTRPGRDGLGQHSKGQNNALYRFRCGGSGPRPSKIAGHGSLTTTQRYLHPDRRSIEEAGTALSAHLSVKRSTNGPHLRAV